ncbi:hypothetical protein [Mycobacteroides abscessus]|uniref:hypothetical protein n=1 Tax=Mycobacteroides abscessus TaxID=36809 RepID=UPI00089DD492|nr:hypothetical protein [Mycobacteroides abscessus]MBN7498301.1 hypothetical protein [Mycobacteroides abscessus subsp. abscessus]PVA40041.1 hypothetical protein DDJ48_26055 [Mycobacteroides abscessus]RIU05653.1 hypothetical protein D2F01_25130 [Mycobacteroides abscessus]RIU21496.1 hypothetical protein D2E92_24120 [Mycobacteroides abscessus]SIE84126.1 Uncharacterised protein [Mycobacteroides abscessus subsp. abscessus]
MDFEALRTALHDAVDQIINDHRAMGDAAGFSAQPSGTAETPVVVKGEAVPDWSYTWPGDTEPERFLETTRWDVGTPHKTYCVYVARGTRSAWGKDDRERVIVFGQTGPKTFYPWTEFVETDTGRFAASIPNPEYPRKVLTSSDPLPGRYRDAHVERADQLFDRVTNGPSLRLVVSSLDEGDMVRHGHWVARLRNRI